MWAHCCFAIVSSIIDMIKIKYYSCSVSKLYEKLERNALEIVINLEIAIRFILLKLFLIQLWFFIIKKFLK